MRKLLIAQHSQAMVEYLTNTLQDEWEIHATMDSYPVIDMLQYIKPDGMVIDLNLRPKNGIDVLDEAKPFLPPAVIATTDIVNDHVQSEAERLGVGCLVRIPFRAGYIRECLEKLCSAYPETARDVVWHLHVLGLNPKLTGYRCLIAAVPIFASSPHLMMKELYPSVGQLCGIDDARRIERVIRLAIMDAWIGRDAEVWKRYFPKQGRPGNKEFIAKLAAEV